MRNNLMDLIDGGKIAIIPEGPCEKTLLEILLRAGRLRFDKSQLLEERILGPANRNGKVFKENHLKMVYNPKLHVVLVQDRMTNFNVPRPYDEYMNTPIYIVTKPEIEMLLVHHFDHYDEYISARNKRSGGIKPSQFLCQKLNMTAPRIKSQSYLEETFTPDSLVSAIKQYSKKSRKREAREHHLIDLLC